MNIKNDIVKEEVINVTKNTIVIEMSLKEAEAWYSLYGKTTVKELKAIGIPANKARLLTDWDTYMSLGSAIANAKSVLE